MLAKTLVVFYVWSPDIFVLSFYQNLFSGIAYSIMSNKTLPYHIQIGKGQAHIQKKKKNSYSGQGDLELILGSRQLLNLRIIHSSCKTRFINVEKEITLNMFT